MKKQRTVKLELECLNSRELPGNLLSLLSLDLGGLIGASALQEQRVRKQLPKASALLAETINVRHSDASLSAKTQSLRKHVSAEFAAFLQNISSQSRSPLQADTRLNSFLPTSSPSTPSPRRGYSSVEDSSVSQTIQQPSRMTTVESGLTSQNFGIAVSQVQPQLDELTKALSRKNPITTGPTVVARSEVQQYTNIDVPINANNDNGSNIVEYIPNIYDFAATKNDYEANVMDPELLQLPLHDETPYPDDWVSTRGTYQYYLSVSQPSIGSGGRIRLWDSQNKQNEYTVFNTWTTQNLKPILLNPGFYSGPQIFLEGVEPSWQDHEIEINLKVKWDANGLVWTSNYRAVKATITPRLQTLSIIQNEPNTYPHFGSNTGTAPWDTNILNGLFYQVTISSSLYGSLFSSSPEFVQNVIDTRGFLDGDQGHRVFIPNTVYNGSEYWRVHVKDNATFPLLDSQIGVQPFYGNSAEGWSIANPREYVLKMLDQPGLLADDINEFIMDIKFYQSFKTWIVLTYFHSVNGVLKMNIYPLASITWRVDHLSVGYSVGYGTTQIGSTITSSSLVRSHAKPDKLTLPFGNDVIVFRPSNQVP